jgi:hypothetical protein
MEGARSGEPVNRLSLPQIRHNSRRLLATTQRADTTGLRLVGALISSGQTMAERANAAKRTSRKSRVSSGFAGERLVFGELKKRGFDARFGPRGHEMLVGTGNPPTRVQVKTAHVTPWYVRQLSFLGGHANQVTVFVLIGPEGNPKSARFFVIKNEDLPVCFRPTAIREGVCEPTNKKTYGYIDRKSVERFEDNWEALE